MTGLLAYIVDRVLSASDDLASFLFIHIVHSLAEIAWENRIALHMCRKALRIAGIVITGNRLFDGRWE